MLLFYCSAGHSDSDSECGSESRRKITATASDSGISDNAGGMSSSQSSISNLNSSSEAIYVNETTPLLPPSLKNGDQKVNLMVSSVNTRSNVLSSSPIDIVFDENYFGESGVQARQSFPEVLKTVCFTGTGAVEV